MIFQLHQFLGNLSTFATVDVSKTKNKTPFRVVTFGVAREMRFFMPFHGSLNGNHFGVKVKKCKGIHPPKQTWNLKMDPWKRRFLLETIISRFHVNFWWCMIFLKDFTSWWLRKIRRSPVEVGSFFHYLALFGLVEYIIWPLSFGDGMNFVWFWQKVWGDVYGIA